MSTETPPSSDTADRPKFRGCVFCYGAEWACYGAKRAAGQLTDSDGDD